ncbi:O-antigen ligase family protein [Alcaligenes endophyticus]|uniref:O-antigen ligase family protein n=1 Tax=Alcaligenes endophyticus TaxID=1929088 RepID=A0ABT8EFW5_9BURK|nr:O-antigen ligase family protein [Alcaligenes endophyticus]MCX5590184.1 O-antigen ligase family protein [Alcaligenes endophyticus]MDN4120153.1 O-antigen ligase family protein [Alcaligenes endophyticus]
MLIYNGASWSEFDLPLRYIAVIPILLLCLHYPPTFVGLLSGIWVGAVGTAILAVSELYITQDRATGFTGGIQFGNMGLLLGVFALGIALFGLETRKNAGFILLFLGAGVAGGVISLASGTRGGWLAVPVVLLVFYAAYVKRENALRLGVPVVVGTVLLLGAVSQAPSIKARIELAQSDLMEFQKGNAATSIGARLALWRAESQLIAQRPFIGWSKSEHTLALQDMVAQGKLDQRSSQLANSHNTFLELWIYTGLLGLMGVLFLFFVAGYGFFIKIRSANPYTKFAAVSGLNLVLSYMIFSQTQIMLGRNNTLVFFLLMLCIFWGMMRHSVYCDAKRLQSVE